jgi:hypothetical protein
MACVFGHKWSKYHLLETYAGTLAQVRVCEKCGEFSSTNIPINYCKREQIRELWAKFHGGDLLESQKNFLSSIKGDENVVR